MKISMRLFAFHVVNRVGALFRAMRAFVLELDRRALRFHNLWIIFGGLASAEPQLEVLV